MVAGGQCATIFGTPQMLRWSATSWDLLLQVAIRICKALPCFLFDIACFFLTYFSSLIKTCMYNVCIYVLYVYVYTCNYVYTYVLYMCIRNV